MGRPKDPVIAKLLVRTIAWIMLALVGLYLFITFLRLIPSIP